MKFSIITTTLNSGKTLQETISSVAAQQFTEIEHIIIDGGSTDDTIKIAKRNSSVSIFKSQSGLSIYEGLNLGLSIATGDVVGFLHSDDLFASVNVLNEIENAFKLHQVDGIYGDLHYVDKENFGKIVRKWKSKVFAYSSLKFGWMPPHPTLFLKRAVYKKHGEFDSKYKIAADYDFMLRIFQDLSLRFHYLPKIITKMRMGGTSSRNLNNIIIKSKEDLGIIRRHKIGGIFTLLIKNFSKVKQFL